MRWHPKLLTRLAPCYLVGPEANDEHRLRVRVRPNAHCHCRLRLLLDRKVCSNLDFSDPEYRLQQRLGGEMIYTSCTQDTRPEL